MTAAEPRLRAALVRRPHGVRGELRVEPTGGSAARFAPGTRLVDERTGRTYTVRRARDVTGGDVLLTLDGVDTRELAEALHGAYLCVERADARRLDDDEWFVHDLVGLRAVSESGDDLGAVETVESFVGNDVLVVRHGDDVHRYPLVRSFVQRVSVAEGVVVLTPWEEE